MTDLRYPIGPFEAPAAVSADDRKRWIKAISETPKELGRAVEGLDDEQIKTPYRPGGWTVRQVVHHVPDSHLNAYIRFKWTLTEDEPRIKTYEQDSWALLADSRLPIDVSLDLLEALHLRWVALMRSLDEADWQRKLDHPDMGKIPLDTMLALYAWHGPHHVAHITSLREREGW